MKNLNSQVMSDFAKRRIAYDTETNFGSDIEKQNEWETQIQKELDDLKEFSIQE